MAAELDRRSAFGQIATGVAVIAALPQMALADGAVSKSTVGRAKGKYGARIANLKQAVEAGDFDAVAEEKAAFILFNSGAYPQAKNKPMKAEAIKDTNAIFKALRDGDKAGMKKAYTKYVAANDIKPFPVIDKNNGQGYSGDFDYKVKTPAG